MGPDYIDPGYLSTVSGNQSHNLDVWLMGEAELVNNFTGNSNSDISVIEGVMGYYDGFSGKSNHASTHHVATLTKSNVILVVDAAKTARSIAATVLGFTKFHKNSRILGIILNKIAGKKHENLCRDALTGLRIPIIGIVPKNPDLSLKSRHLGLIPTVEDNQARLQIIKIAKTISEFLDFDKIIKIAKLVQSLPPPRKIQAKKQSCVIAVALDNSFNFYYPANLEALRREGAKIKFFSPVSDTKFPTCDGIYIGGGFPEVLSEPLSKNHTMKNQIKQSLENDTPLYAECGGLMYLTRSIHDGRNKFPMVGFFDAQTVMTTKMKLNYTKAKITSECIISGTPKNFQGHEFHYSELTEIARDTRFAYDISVGSGIIKNCDGIIQNKALASYGHLYFDSKNFAKTFVSNCLKS